MAVSTVYKTAIDGSIKLLDGTSGTPLEITLSYDNGDFSCGPLKDVLNEDVAFERRGKFMGVRAGARIYPTGSFTATMTQFSDATAGTLADFLLRNGNYSAAVSTLGSTAEIYTVDIELTVEGTDHGDAADHTMTLEDCSVRIDSFSEGEPNSFSISFTCYGAITGDLAADELT